MVNFSNVEIVRAIMHQVSAKEGNRPSEVTASDKVLNLDDESKRIIKDRLNTAFGRQSKSFELEIQNDSVDSCFAKVKALCRIENEDSDSFIGLSVSIAQALANSQRVSRIPGGFLLVVHCLYEDKPLFVLIKAEPHDALGVNEMDVKSIKNIILSPEQKLYKAVYFELKSDVGLNEEIVKDHFRVVLFDSNVNTNSIIAQYFFQDFLGLSIQGNAKLQTALFYQKMTEKIWSELSGMAAINASDALRVKVLDMNAATINPHEVINTIIPEGYRDPFLAKIINDFPISFSRDTSLIDASLEKKTITLSDKVKITAPSHYFADNVIIEESAGEYLVRIKR